MIRGEGGDGLRGRVIEADVFDAGRVSARSCLSMKRVYGE